MLFLISIAFTGTAQVVGGVQAKGLDIQTRPNGFVSELPMAPPETIGDVYLESQWFIGDILLFNQTKLQAISIRLNLERNNLEINANDGVKVLQGAIIQQFSWENSSISKREDFINGNKFQNEEMLGFFKIISPGDWSLLSKTNLTLVRGNYIAALDVGDRTTKYVKKEEFYFAQGPRAYKCNLSKNKFVNQFEESKQKQLKEFVYKLSLKNEEDLLIILKYLRENLK